MIGLSLEQAVGKEAAAEVQKVADWLCQVGIFSPNSHTTLVTAMAIWCVRELWKIRTGEASR